MSKCRHHDVAILGGGLAGNLLARQLRRARPDVSVALIEPSERAARKVGESTVEIASDYLVRRHGLSTHLYDRQLPKNGLRFFFDTPTRDAELLSMSELGSDHIPLFPTFQLDRARFEDDLRAMNHGLGVDARIGASVRRVELSSDGGPHRVTFRDEGAERTLTARWVVDATGRHRAIGRMLDLQTPVDHGLSAVWARFTGVVDIDAIDAPGWRSRVRHTARGLSTNHFCYPGYWIWLIPLGAGVTSVGLVGERDVFPPGVRTREGFVAFLARHHAVRALLADAEMIDIGGYTQVAYGTKRFFDGANRWAVVGDAAAFVDPLYSPGSDFIAIENDLVTDLVGRDLSGQPVAELAGSYDDFLQLRHAATLLLYQGQYPALGSFEVLRLKWNFDLATYYNLWLDSYRRDHHLDPRRVRSQVRRGPYILSALRGVRDLFSGMAAELDARGHYHRGNLGRYNDGTDLLWFQRDVGTDRRRREVDAVTAAIFEHTWQGSVELLGERRDAAHPLASLAGQLSLT